MVGSLEPAKLDIARRHRGRDTRCILRINDVIAARLQDQNGLADQWQQRTGGIGKKISVVPGSAISEPMPLMNAAP